MNRRIGWLLILQAMVLHGIMPGRWDVEAALSGPLSTVRGEQAFDPRKLRDITGIERTPVSPSLFPHWELKLGIAIFTIPILGLACWILTRRPRSQTNPEPFQWALNELNHIETLELPAKGKIDNFHTLVGKAIRKYLELQFQVPALSQTTDEFLSTIQSASLLPSSQQTILREFLERCDLANFAQKEYSLQECQEIISRARGFVKQIRTLPANAFPKK